MTFTECNGVRFYEGLPPDVTQGEAISTRIGGALRNSQLASLRDVKVHLAEECRKRGGSVIVRFTYGQKSAGLLASLFSRDDVLWYGQGYIGNVQVKQ